MSELPEQDRLQPSLLDRLLDDEPGRRDEPRERRVLSLADYRMSVRRDLEDLLNTGNLVSWLRQREAASPGGNQHPADLEAFPQVASSVLNFGIPDLTGLSAAGMKAPDLERAIRQCILDFEPRLLRNSVRVTAVIDPEHMSRSAVTFEIEGTLWAHPLPLELFLRTDIDPETGRVEVEEGSPS